MRAEQDRIVFDAVVGKGGLLEPVEGQAARARVARWAGRRITVILERWIRPKTQQQLGYYFDVIVPTWAEDAGYTEREMHVELKRAFLRPVTVTARLTGEEREELPSLRDCTVEQMSAYIETVLREAAERGLYIPEARGSQRAVGI